MSQNFAHQQKLFNPRFAKPVTIIGVGAIGSYVALVVAKMGVTDITAIDHDIVTSHNGPMSLYCNRDIGKLKVTVLQERIEALTGVVIKAKATKYTGEPLRKTTVISCVDLMSVRSTIWKEVKGNLSIDLFVDTRTAEAYAEVFAINPRLKADQVRYEKFLFPDSQAARQFCGSHGVVFVSCQVAATVGSILARYWTNGQKNWRYPMKCDTLEHVQP